MTNEMHTGISWRIITSVKHSTLWDGKRLLFDFNFSAMGIPRQRMRMADLYRQLAEEEAKLKGLGLPLA